MNNTTNNAEEATLRETAKLALLKSLAEMTADSPLDTAQAYATLVAIERQANEPKRDEL